jgi:IS30 family transposase
LLWVKWSPEQIARKLGLQGELSISAETIYRSDTT